MDPHLNLNHKARRNCTCDPCRNMRGAGCENPHKCGKYARDYMGKIGRKWNPVYDDVDRKLTGDEKELLQTTGGIIFNPDIILKGSLTGGFRVFTGNRTQDDINNRDYSRTYIGQPLLTTVYTDGSCEKNGSIEAVAGAGIWFGKDDPRNRALRLPVDIPQTNNTGETVAVLKTLKMVPGEQSVKIMSDSQLVIDSLTKHLKKHEDEGWIGTANGDLMRKIAASMRSRKGLTIFEKVKGHAGILGNEEADKLAGIGAKKLIPDVLDMEMTKGYDLRGAKLEAMTQAKMYQGIVETKPTPERQGTLIHLDMTRWAIKDINQEAPTDERIWLSLKDKALSREARAFLWKTMHNAYKVRKYWENIPNYENRALCPECDNAIETMEHILTECRASGQDTIWKMAELLHERRKIPFVKPPLGAQLGCALANRGSGKDKAGARRFSTIVVSEASRMIWKIRCEWWIARGSDPEKRLTEAEIKNRFRKALACRLKLDCLATDKSRFGRRATENKVVRNTWKHFLEGSLDPLKSWRIATEVLVGIG